MKKNKVIPARDANENTKAYRERAAKEAEEKQRMADFKRFVTEKKEDYTLTVLGSLLQHTKTDKTKIEENVGIAVAYADALLSRIYGIRKAPDVPVGDAGENEKKEEAPVEPAEKDAVPATEEV